MENDNDESSCLPAMTNIASRALELRREGCVCVLHDVFVFCCRSSGGASASVQRTRSPSSIKVRHSNERPSDGIIEAKRSGIDEEIHIRLFGSPKTNHIIVILTFEFSIGRSKREIDTTRRKRR